MSAPKPNYATNPSGARRFNALCRKYAAGRGKLSEVDLVLIKQAAGLTIEVERQQARIVAGEDVNHDAVVRLSSETRRVLDRLNGRNGDGALPSSTEEPAPLPKVTIIEAMDRADLFAKHFPGPSWSAWRTFLKALFALPMDAGELELFRECTGLDEPPREAAKEAWVTVGRRGGKSRVLALVATYLSCFRGWALASGQTGYVVVIAPDRKQAREIFGYVRTFIADTPLLKHLLSAQTKESLELANGITIEIVTCSPRTIRGSSVVCGLLDEVAYWPTEASANPGADVVNALRPCLGGIDGSMLIAASSPAGRNGVHWQAHQRYHGQPGAEALSWQAPTLTMHPTYPRGPIERAYAENPFFAAADYGAQFRDSEAALITRDALAACTSTGVLERPPVAGRSYFAFVDVASGAKVGRDSTALAIAHREDRTIVLDLIREKKPPCDLDEVAADFARTLRDYGLTIVQGDAYADSMVERLFLNHRVCYRADAPSKNDLFNALAGRIGSGSVNLLDNAPLREQLLMLEVNVTPAGRTQIAQPHQRGAHDDVANAVAGAIALVSGGKRNMTVMEAMAIEESRYTRAELDRQWRFGNAYPGLRGLS